MKQRKSVFIISALVLIISAVLTVGGCRSATGGGVVHVTSVSLNITAYTFLNNGDEVQLEAKIFPENATNKNVTWKSLKESRITVDQTGKVKYKRNYDGAYSEDIYVLVTTEDGGYISACKIHVFDDL
jgi:bacterial group 2 Ig-like protein